jgi:cobalt-zinc-cadmium efflux system outer membrane protein
MKSAMKPAHLERALFSLLRMGLLSLMAQTASAGIDTPQGSNDPLLPLASEWATALRDSPAVRAAVSHVLAEQSVQRQLAIGPQEWTATASAARRAQSQPTSEKTAEWELGLERALRLPGKREAYERAGLRRVEQAELVLRKVWMEQSRLLLERRASWLRERESERVWHTQVTLLRQQLTAISKRQALGDAARIERELAQAAVAQVLAQWAASGGREQAARETLLRLFPSLVLQPDAALPAPAPLTGTDSEWIAAQLRHNPELAMAQGETKVALATLAVDSAEVRPDPTVGVRVGRARSGAEQTLGLVLSMPFGGDYRAAGVSASRARAEAASWQLADAQRRAEVEANQRVRDMQMAFAAWQSQSEAANRLAQAADSLARGYQLGEGSLGDTLQARRLANEQQLATAASAVDVWTTRHRLQLEAGVLWPLAASVTERGE